MSLGNLSVKVGADITGYTSNMSLAATVARDKMGASATSVEQFRQSLLQTSAQMQQFALSMNQNMAAANQSVMTNSQKMASIMAVGIGGGMEATRTAWDGFQSYVKAKLIITGLAIATGVAAVVFTGIYAAYKAADFVVGLFTGDSYKSASIDALIAINDRVKDLQQTLQLTAQQASATDAAIDAIGANRDEIKEVFANAQTAIHANTEEMDRLGVKYKDVKGNLLPLQEVLKNGNTVLNTYTEGWDRNQAAIALGLGSADKVAKAVELTKEKVQEAGDRLNDYNLGIGTESQAAVARYESAMREFNRETELTSSGFKRAWADQIMPILTDLAEFFREGFPFAVNVFRYSMATVTSLFYGLKTSVYIVAESVIGSIQAIGNVLAGLAAAASRALVGDFAGAKVALVAGWTDAKERLNEIGKGIVTQASHNAAAMRQAWAFDDRRAGLNAAPPESAGRGWTPAPKKDDKIPAGPIDDAAKKFMEGKLKEQEDLIADEQTLLQTREEFLKHYYSEDLITAEDYYTAKSGLIAGNLAGTLAAYDAEIAALEAYKVVHAQESDKQADIVAADNKIAEIRRKKAQAEIQNNKDIAVSYFDLSAERLNIANSLMRAGEIEDKSFASRMASLTAYRNAQVSNQVDADLQMERERKRHQEATIAADLQDKQRTMDTNNFLLQNSKRYSDQVRGYWLAANATVQTSSQQSAKLTASAISSATDGIASSISQAIIYGKNLGESLRNVAASVADSFIQGFIKMQIQKFLIDKTASVAYAATIAAQSSAMVAMAGLAAFASTAAIPIVGPAMAPAAAAAATGMAAVFGGTATAAAAASISARGGYDIPDGINPVVQTHEREMILPKAQADVIRGLAANGGGSSGAPIQVNTSITLSDHGASAQASGDSSEKGRALADMINTQIKYILVRETRQGGILWNQQVRGGA